MESTSCFRHGPSTACLARHTPRRPRKIDISKECNAAYVRLCTGFRPGPEMLGRCFAKRPTIADKIPAKCTEDFQTNIENYNDAKKQ